MPQREPMQCFVYKSLVKRDVYVYLDRRDDFSRLPEALLGLLGQLQLVVEFELTPERRLAKETAAVVLESLAARGYHLQMPDIDMPASDTAH